MIDFNEPALADREKARNILLSCSYRANDYSFGNLFIWRKKNEIRIAFHSGLLLICFQYEGKFAYLYPAGNGDRGAALREMALDAKQRGIPFMMAGVVPVAREELETLFPGRFRFVEDRKNYDYIYNASDLIELKGKKYHSKRNHITRFKTVGDWSYEDLTPANLQECVQMNDEWCRENGCGSDQGLRDEYGAVREALRYYEPLGFEGGILRKYSKVVAFTIGEPLCDDTFVVHIEKAFSSIEGAYPVINNEFSARVGETYHYINREEDTGDEGLRKAKLSYQPAMLLQKDIAVLQGGDQL